MCWNEYFIERPEDMHSFSSGYSMVNAHLVHTSEEKSTFYAGMHSRLKHPQMRLKKTFKLSS